ncbi:MAG: nucleotidyl transferase AbiEii/AbiGii toxin family protein [Coriobacteriia bacterium]|nr:nucleotidyl transferase AbiEii/AbiGii toxin family protein [Coriobacteriia bacterium]
MAINVQLGHIARHTPKGSGAQGREAAIIDVAQDLLLRHLHEVGILDDLVFKGGTALRKLFAGRAGRFSLDLDFSLATIGADPDEVLSKIITTINGLRLERFEYGASERRGKWTLSFSHPFGGTALSLQSKLDLSPPPWLDPIKRGWAPMEIHKQYGNPPLPEIQVVRIEENIAEKIARLNRSTPARDLYDLCWIMSNPGTIGSLDKPLIRRLALLKIWVDTNGVHAGTTYWQPGHKGLAFDPEVWLRDRSKEGFDIDDIGALTAPSPTASELSDGVRTHFAFLAELDDDEGIVAHVNERDRALVLRMLSELPGGRLIKAALY